MAKKTSTERLDEALAGGEIVTQSAEDKASADLRAASEDKIQAAFAEAKSRLAKLKTAKDSDFSELTEDLWKPTKAGDTLRGIYLGVQEGNRLKQYAFGVHDEESGEDLAVRINGSIGLKRLLERVNVGDVCLVTFDGKKAMEGGRSFNQFRVAVNRK